MAFRKSFEIIAYTYDADLHCIECTKAYIKERHGDNWVHDLILGFTTVSGSHLYFSDSEGNEIHPVFLDQYSDFVADVDGPDGGVVAYAPACGDCGNIIDD